MNTVSNIPVPTVNVRLVGIDARKAAIFSMAFRMHTTVQYELVDTAQQADVIVVDVDGVDGKMSWDKVKTDHPTTPRVYASVLEPEFDVAYLPKPVKVESLFPVLRAALSGLDTFKVAEAKAKSTGRERLSFKDQAKHYKTTVTDEVDAPAAPRDVQFPVEQVQAFNANSGLLGAARALVNRQENLALLVENKPVLMFFADINRVLLAVPPEQLEAMCTHPQLVVETKAIGERPEWKKHAKTPLDSCLWQFAIWSAQGRLPTELDANQSILLRSWPNITRLAHIPDAMRLSAFLTKAPVNLPMVYKMIRVDIKDLLNFISACYVIKLLDVIRGSDAQAGLLLSSAAGEPSMAVVTGTEAATQPHTPARPKQSRSMLQRLLRKLTGQ